MTGAWRHLLLAGALVLGPACTSGAEDTEASAAASPSPVTPAVEDPSPASVPATIDPTEAASPTPDTTGVATPAPANAAVLDFTARRLAGGTFDGVQLAGRDVALWMWAPWCPQCNREAPHVAEAVAAWGDEVAIVGVAGHDTDAAHRAFVEEHGLGGMIHLVDDDGSLWAQYDVTYQPAWVLVDDDGHVERVAGGLYDTLDARLRALADG